jgi:ribosomal protein S18 acetylase RimI-like enzyme
VTTRSAGLHVTTLLHDMRTQSFRYRGGVVRIAAWQGRADVASLALRGRGPLAPASVERLLARVRAEGYREVVTNALAPAATLPLVDAGFDVRGRLRVLVHDFADLPEVTRRTRRAHRSERAAMVDADRAAFDEFWRLDANGLREAARATPSSHLRVTRDHGPLGYALFGRATTDGYVQRLAVHPEVQGCGYGTALLTDGLHWLRRRGATRAYVNTQSDNDRAYALYERSGFRALPVGLCVLGRTL